MDQRKIDQRKKLTAFARNTLLSEECNDGVRMLTCKCAKCKHESTIEAQKCLEIRETNKNISNTVLQHILGTGYVEEASNGPFINLNKKWSPEKGWYLDEKSDKPLVQDRSLESSSDKMSYSDAVKQPIVKQSKVEQQKVEQPTIEQPTIEQPTVEQPTIYLGPIITHNRTPGEKNNTMVNYIPLFIKSPQGIFPIAPNNSFNYSSYKAVEPMVDEQKQIWYTPIIVLNKNQSGKLEPFISYIMKIYCDDSNCLQYYEI